MHPEIEGGLDDGPDGRCESAGDDHHRDQHGEGAHGDAVSSVVDAAEIEEPKCDDTKEKKHLNDRQRSADSEAAFEHLEIDVCFLAEGHLDTTDNGVLGQGDRPEGTAAGGL